jgi:hypothetical protein
MSKDNPNPGELNKLSAAQQQALEKTQRFLLNVTDPTLVSRVQLHGYDNEEHSYGWRLYAEASGMKLPLNAFVSAQKRAQVPEDDRSYALFRALDQFENKWFPRVEAALKRYIAPEAYAAFSAAFFQDLSQQPEGPAVVISVTKLLDRTEALATSQTPGAPEAFASLVKRGLDEPTRAQVRDLLDRAQRMRPVEVSADAAVDAVAISQAQQESYRQLIDWYQDWATTLRQELDHRALVRLGLRASKPKKKTLDEEAASPEDTSS